MSGPDHSTLIFQALDFAASKHKDQKRKGKNREPYINHPIEVARLIAEIGGIVDPDILIAAVLHDTIEDTDTTAEELENLFGSRAASFVVEVTDDKSLPKSERKRLQVEHAPHLSPEAKIIKLADKISNVRDIVSNPPDGWNLKQRREYIQWARDIIAGVEGANQQLESLFSEIAKRASEGLNEQSN